MRGEQLWAPGGCCGRSGALGTMALCARAALLLGVLQVLALLGAAQDPTDAQGSASGNHSVLTSNINITGKYERFKVSFQVAIAILAW